MAAFEVIALDTATPQLRAPGASDTYTFPRAVEMPLGTANGVLYLDGSKVVTSGSALTYNGSTLATTGALTVDGNVTLGNASTDTVQVNGYMGVGGSPATDSAIRVASGGSGSGNSQNGVYVRYTGTSSATSYLAGVQTYLSTPASAYTVSSVYGVAVSGVETKGAGSTITNQHGVYIFDQTQGTNNYGITSLVSSGTDKWNIYASGTAANYFAGNVGIGTSSPAYKFHLRGFTDSLPAASGTNQTGVGLRIQPDNTAGILDIGLSAGVAAWLQSTNSGNLATNYALALNPNGGNVSIGGTATRATTAGSKALNIFDGTAPVGTLANGISIYSSSGEAYVMDAAGNATLFSPHDAETNEWIFKSKHTPTGKVLKIDVERLLRFVNDHFGLDAVQEFIEP